VPYDKKKVKDWDGKCWLRRGQLNQDPKKHFARYCGYIASRINYILN